MHLDLQQNIRSRGQMESTVSLTGKPNTLIWSRKENP